MVRLADVKRALERREAPAAGTGTRSRRGEVLGRGDAPKRNRDRRPRRIPAFSTRDRPIGPHRRVTRDSGRRGGGSYESVGAEARLRCIPPRARAPARLADAEVKRALDAGRRPPRHGGQKPRCGLRSAQPARLSISPPSARRARPIGPHRLVTRDSAARAEQAIDGPRLADAERARGDGKRPLGPVAPKPRRGPRLSTALPAQRSISSRGCPVGLREVS
jgi:hypothetical protein